MEEPVEIISHKKPYRKKNPKSCFQCQSSHKKCDTKRPCESCTLSNRTCSDLPLMTNLEINHLSSIFLNEANNKRVEETLQFVRSWKERNNLLDENEEK